MNNLGYFGPPVLAFVFALALVITVLVKNHRTPINRLFATFLGGMALWAFVIFFMRSSPTAEQALPWDRAILPVGALTSVVFYHFSMLMAGIKLPRWGIIALYSYLALIIGLSPTTLLFADMSIKPYGYAPVMGPLALPLWVIPNYTLSILALINLARGARNAITYEEKNRFRYILVGTVFFLVGALFDLLPILGLPAYPGAIFGNIILSTLTTIAIVRHHLLDIRFVVRRGTGYLLASILIAIPYVGCIVAVNFFVKDAISVTTIYFLVIVVGAIGLQPLWRWAQLSVDRLFSRGTYDYLRSLQELTSRSHRLNDMPALTATVGNLTMAALRAMNCHLLFRTSRGFEDNPVPGQTSQYIFKSGHPVVRWLENHDALLHSHELRSIPVLQAQTIEERQVLNDLQAELYAPVTTASRDLVAIMAIGPKRGGALYSFEDEKTVSQMTQRLAVPFENAYLFRSEQELRQEIEREVKDRTEFLVAAAHEMRTPLTSIMASGEMLAGEVSNDPGSPLYQLVDNIRVAADALHHRTSELLEFARLRSGALDLKLDAVEANQLVAALPRQFAPILHQREQELVIEPHPSSLVIHADYNRLQQVITNLISNAAKFSPLKARLVVRVESMGDEAVVRVFDRAAPLSEVERGKLFQPFYRGEDLRKPGTGLGLGLAISRQIIAAHQGRIWVEVTREGNIFSFAIPLSPPDNPPA